ncbi:hypothetical protein [Shewanella algae]|nr:hypothetical protein [Shewanella algae]
MQQVKRAVTILLAVAIGISRFDQIAFGIIFEVLAFALAVHHPSDQGTLPQISILVTLDPLKHPAYPPQIVIFQF